MTETSLTDELNGFFPCKSCSNVLTQVCFDDCMYLGNFKHYHQRPGTDIKELPSFPLDWVLKEESPRDRLMAIGIYLMAVVDYLQHMDEYARNRELYKNGHGDGRPNVDDSGSKQILDHLPLAALLDGSTEENPPYQIEPTQDSDKGDGPSTVDRKAEGS